MTNWTAFLGGRDLEMVEINKLLAQCEGVVVHDRQLAWGAKASSYASEIAEAIDQSGRVMLVELIDDLPADFPRDRVDFIDHHGPLAGEDRPTAIEQIFLLLGFPPERWTRHIELVAANDRGHIAGMLAVGATLDEIRHIRAADRLAQGITIQEEAIGREAALRAESYLGGKLKVVRLSHGRTATVTDALDPSLGGPSYRNLLIFSPSTVTFYGEGSWIEALRARFPGGFFGGAIPVRGYWGFPSPLRERDVLDALVGLE